MRILLSASDITNATNGLARSARDFCAGLRARGHEVRVIFVWGFYTCRLPARAPQHSFP